MLQEKVKQLLNEQINKEFYSAYLYLDIANYYTEQGLHGFANWYTVQAQEERDHALLFMKYLQNNDEKVTFEAVAKPDKVFADLKAPLSVGLEHERYVTSLIHTIYDAALQRERFPDHAVFGLVRQGTGRGRNQCRRSGEKDGAFWIRRQEPVYAGSGAGRPGICRAFAGSLKAEHTKRAGGNFACSFLLKII